MNYTVFPFGKFKGIAIHAIESNYIIHALENFDLPDDLINQLRYEIFIRFSIPFYESDGVDIYKINSVYKKLANIYHPDKGGSDLAMQAINQFKSELS